MSTETQFWTTVDSFTSSRWWSSVPALLVSAVALLLLLVAAARLRERNLFCVALTAVALGAAVSLLLPGALLALNPLVALQLDGGALDRLPTTAAPAIAQTYDRAMQLGYAGSGVLLVGALGALGALGNRRGDPCPSCGRQRHPTWGGVCPECQLLEPARQPKVSAPREYTQFGALDQTALLDGGVGGGAWLEIVEAAHGIGERLAIGARLTVGRAPGECQLVLEDDSVSARHAYIEREGDHFVLFDWGSRNGTIVHGQPVARHELHDGEEVLMGRVRLRFSAPSLAKSEHPTVLFERPTGARIVALDGPQAGTAWSLVQLDTRLGRATKNDVVLEAPTVSRHHASISSDGTSFSIADMGSPNGTWLDDVRILDRALLRAGQTIRLGDQRLRFEREEAPHAPVA